MRFKRLAMAIMASVLTITAIGVIPATASAEPPPPEGCGPGFWADLDLNRPLWSKFKPYDKFKVVLPPKAGP